MEQLIQKLHAIFPNFEEELIHQIAQNATIRNFKEGEILMRSGENVRWTILLTKGKVKIYTNGEEGEDYFMYFLEPGQACAMSFICATRNKKSELEAVAAEDTEVVFVPIELLDSFMLKYKSWYYFVLENYRSRFQELLDTMRSIAFHSMDERLEYYLMKQKNAFNSNELHLTHEQIANDLNTSRVVISRLLKQMENNQLLKLNRNSILLLQ